MTHRYLSRPLPLRAARGLTLVEMLVAMAITLLLMAAVVTVFANVSSSVTRRRATIEMSTELRTVRETLARDLAGATCPAIPWQRPEANHGYLEIIEGPQNDYYPTPWLWDGPDSGSEPDPIGQGADATPGIDLAVSSLPGSDLGGNPVEDVQGRGLSIGSRTELPDETPTDGRGLGDGDDILMLTVRNEKEPFVGRIPRLPDRDFPIGSQQRTNNTPASPNQRFSDWGGSFLEVESQLAEVVWHSLENPVDPNRTFAFGEPGYRTIYRRALLILPDVDYEIYVNAGGIGSSNSTDSVAAGPGAVRVLLPGVTRERVGLALAALIAFQERYDLSVRLEWDPTLPGNGGRWVIRANSLGDLTKRENRYEHHGYIAAPETAGIRRGATVTGPDRYFPFAAASAGVYGSGGTFPVSFVADNELASTLATGYQAIATDAGVVTYVQQNDFDGGAYLARPLALVNRQSDFPATARAVLNEDGQVVHVTTGLVPLGGARRGDDLMMAEALAFDLRVYDPGAPVYGYFVPGATNQPADQIVSPGDPMWVNAYAVDVSDGRIGNGSPLFAFERQGAYVDLGYGRSALVPPNAPATAPAVIENRFLRPGLLDRWDRAEPDGFVRSRFFNDGLIRTGTGPSGVAPTAITRRFASYDTWSWHYETNGLNEDGDRLDGVVRGNLNDSAAIDEGANGLDDAAVYHDDANSDFVPDTFNLDVRLGPDDANERETRPPYDTALRGMQVSLRVYERDSRQIREVRVRESFVPE